MKRILTILVCLLGCAGGGLARAHDDGTSFLSVELRGDGQPALKWDLPVHDLIWSVYIDADYDGAASWAEIQAARDSIDRAVLKQIAVSRGGVDCQIRFEDFALATRLGLEYLSLDLTADCPAPGGLEVGGLLFLLGNGQRVLVTATRDATEFDGVISASAPSWREPERLSAWATFTRFVGEGVWHVLIGFDHIAFILLLLLPSVLKVRDGRWQGADRMSQVWRDLVFIVTAFTVAHSATLALAATGTVDLPAKPVEITIAASIAVAALINLMPRLAALRLPLAFGFGLVHGFGFANVLGELDGRGGGLVPVLAGFNIGVELAQLGIVALVLPLCSLARRSNWYAAGAVPLGSCALGAAGLVWLVQRI